MNYFYFIKRLIFLLVIIFFCDQGIAQTTDQNYPVTAQAFVVGQSGKKLSAYFSNTQALTVSLLLKDLTKTNVDVYLRWSIDGPGVRIASVDGYIPPTFINLQRGMLKRFSGLDLQSTYFRQELIEAQGLAGPVMRSSLPEGFYTFRVQALEAGTGREVSNMGETYFSITSPLPPVINIPSNGVTLASTGSATGVSATGGSATGSLSLSKGVVQVQWMPRHYKLPGNITSYDLKVCKIPDGYQPQEAIDACVNPIIDDRGNPGTFYPSNTGIGNSIIGEWDPSTAAAAASLGMTSGARYAVRVTVHEFDQNGDEVVFANEGRSEVTWFRYGEPCRSPENFTIKETGPGRVVLNWAAQAGADSYRILWRTSASINSASGASINSATGSLSVSKGASSVTKWNEQTVSSSSGMVQGLTVGNYEFKVQNAACPDVPENAQTFEIGKEDDEDKLPPALTNPMQIIVQTSGCDTASIADLASYYTNFPGVVASGVTTTPDNSGNLVIPACALVSGAFSDCDAPLPVITPPATGTSLTSLKAGDVLGIYDAAAFVTEATEGPDGFSGTALVRMPFLNGMLIPFAFTGLKAWASEGAAGGCVYAVTSFHSISKLSNADALAMKSKLLTALAGRQDPAAYVGTLADALKSYENLPTGSNGCPYKTAILQASDTFKDALDDLDTDNPVITSILNDLKNITDSLQAGNTVNDITQKYETIFARLDSLKKADLNNNPATLAISNVQVNELTGQSARISWEITGNETKTPSRYVIEYTAPNGATLQETVNSTKVNLQRLLPGNRYTYRILAYDGDKVVATYGEDAFTTQRKIVPVPENLAYTALNQDGVKITWDANRDHRSYKLIYTDQFGVDQTLYPTTNSARINGLARDVKYGYRILAVGDNGLESEIVNSDFTVGVVCETRAYASKPRVIQGQQVQLWLAGCLDEDGRNGPAEWTDGETTFPRRVIYVTPNQTTTYVANCLLTRQLENGQTEPVYCPAEVTVMVDRKCDGVVATVTPTSVKYGESFILKSAGCAKSVRWQDSYPEGAYVSGKAVDIITPTLTKEYYLSCKDKDGKQCWQNAGKVNVGCENFILTWTSKSDTRGHVYVTAHGCTGDVTWRETDKENRITTTYSADGHSVQYDNINKKGFSVQATCKESGCYYDTGFIGHPGHKEGCVVEVELIQETSKSITLKGSSGSNVQFRWLDNNSTKTPREFPMPKGPTIYTVYFNGHATDGNLTWCSSQLLYTPKKLSNTVTSIQCNEFSISVPTTVSIPINTASVNSTLTSAGCTNGVENYPVAWKKEGVQISSSDATSTVVTLYAATDKNKIIHVSATCSLTGETKTGNISVTQIDPQPLNPIDPCNFFVYTRNGYNYFPKNTRIEFTILGVCRS